MMQSADITLVALRQYSLHRLGSLYPPEEAAAIFRALAQHFLPEWQTLWLQSRGEAPFPSALFPAWKEALERLLQREPLPYIIGKATFGDIVLRVGAGVFIPRPETEMWVYALLEKLQPTLPHTILDIGTGSGAIAIFLAKKIPSSMVFAIDKSPIAVHYANLNARCIGVPLRIERLTFGSDPLPSDFPSEWDLIVSNPPYIPWSAYGETEPNVRIYEPPEALFCTDLGLYEKMAAFARATLSPRGIIAAELFPPQAEAVAAIWRRYELSVTLHQDLEGRQRWIWGQRK